MKHILLITLLLISSFCIFPDDLSDLFTDMETISDQNELSLTINGTHDFLYVLPFSDTKDFEEPTFKSNFYIKYKAKNIEIISNWIFYIPDNKINADENYIKINFNKTKISIGNITYSWGTADKKNPTNYLNSKDYSDILDVKTLPVVSISLEQYFSNFSVQVVYIPVKNENVFDFETDVYDGIEDFIIGGCFNYYGDLDISLSYIYDIDDFYTLDNDLNLSNQRINRIGLSSKTTLNIFGIWTELNYSNVDISSDYLEWTTGFDFNWGSTNQGYVNLQYTGKWIKFFEIDNVQNTYQNISEEITQGIIMSTNYTFYNEEIELELISIYLISINEENSFALKPGINYTPIDSLNFNLSMQLINNIEENDNITLKVSYSW